MGDRSVLGVEPAVYVNARVTTFSAHRGTPEGGKPLVWRTAFTSAKEGVANVVRPPASAAFT
ncbi:MAG: hypothetical protein ING75_10635 [Rhodocyclaceae bacterium]|nr:hypothetical protein [Rhodocyclaceae bacterium]